MKFATVIALSWYVETHSAIYTPRDHYLLAMIDRAECVYIFNVNGCMCPSNNVGKQSISVVGNPASAHLKR